MHRQLLALFIRKPRLLWRILQNIVYRLFSRPRLHTLVVDVTYACPCACEQCFSADFARPGEKYLTVQELECLFVEARKTGAFHILLSGGEPLVRKDILEIVALVHRHGYIASVSTSGVNLTRDMLVALKKSGLNFLLLSVDFTSAALHDENRGFSGLHEKVFALVDFAQELGVGVIINSVASSEKLRSGELLRLRDVFAKKRIPLNITAPIAIGRWAQKPTATLHALDQALFNKHIKLRGIRSDTQSTYRGLHCPAGTEKLSISAYGDVKACQGLGRAYGNIRSESLASIWRRMLPRVARLKKETYCPAGNRDYLARNADLL